MKLNVTDWKLGKILINRMISRNFDKEMNMEYKYMRIQGRENAYITEYPKGVFSLCWNLIKEE